MPALQLRDLTAETSPKESKRSKQPSPERKARLRLPEGAIEGRGLAALRYSMQLHMWRVVWIWARAELAGALSAWYRVVRRSREESTREERRKLQANHSLFENEKDRLLRTAEDAMAAHASMSRSAAMARTDEKHRRMHAGLVKLAGLWTAKRVMGLAIGFSTWQLTVFETAGMKEIVRVTQAAQTARSKWESQLQDQKAQGSVAAEQHKQALRTAALQAVQRVLRGLVQGEKSTVVAALQHGCSVSKLRGHQGASQALMHSVGSLRRRLRQSEQSICGNAAIAGQLGVSARVALNTRTEIGKAQAAAARVAHAAESLASLAGQRRSFAAYSMRIWLAGMMRQGELRAVLRWRATTIAEVHQSLIARQLASAESAHDSILLNRLNAEAAERNMALREQSEAWRGKVMQAAVAQMQGWLLRQQQGELRLQIRAWEAASNQDRQEDRAAHEEQMASEHTSALEEEQQRGLTLLKSVQSKWASLSAHITFAAVRHHQMSQTFSRMRQGLFDHKVSTLKGALEKALAQHTDQFTVLSSELQTEKATATARFTEYESTLAAERAKWHEIKVSGDQALAATRNELQSEITELQKRWGGTEQDHFLEVQALETKLAAVQVESAAKIARSKADLDTVTMTTAAQTQIWSMEKDHLEQRAAQALMEQVQRLDDFRKEAQAEQSRLEALVTAAEAATNQAQLHGKAEMSAAESTWQDEWESQAAVLRAASEAREAQVADQDAAAQRALEEAQQRGQVEQRHVKHRWALDKLVRMLKGGNARDMGISVHAWQQQMLKDHQEMMKAEARRLVVSAETRKVAELSEEWGGKLRGQLEQAHSRGKHQLLQLEEELTAELTVEKDAHLATVRALKESEKQMKELEARSASQIELERASTEMTEARLVEMAIEMHAAVEERDAAIRNSAHTHAIAMQDDQDLHDAAIAALNTAHEADILEHETTLASMRGSWQREVGFLTDEVAALREIEEALQAQLVGIVLASDKTMSAMAEEAREVVRELQMHPSLKQEQELKPGHPVLHLAYGRGQVVDYTFEGKLQVQWNSSGKVTATPPSMWGRITVVSTSLASQNMKNGETELTEDDPAETAQLASEAERTAQQLKCARQMWVLMVRSEARNAASSMRRAVPLCVYRWKFRVSRKVVQAKLRDQLDKASNPPTHSLHLISP